MNASLSRRIVAEAIGTALLLAAVVGSGIMAERLSSGNQAVALLANTIATAAALAALILTFGRSLARTSIQSSLSRTHHRVVSPGVMSLPT